MADRFGYWKKVQAQENLERRKAHFKLKLAPLSLSKKAKERLIQLSEGRYDPKTDILNLPIKSQMTREQNKNYGRRLIKKLLTEALKVDEAWVPSPEDMPFIKSDMISLRVPNNFVFFHVNSTLPYLDDPTPKPLLVDPSKKNESVSESGVSGSSKPNAGQKWNANQKSTTKAQTKSQEATTA